MYAAMAVVSAPDTILPRAEADLRAAVRQRPDYARTWYTLGHLLQNSGRFAEAYDAARTAYDTDAFLSDIRGVVGLLFLASLHTERFDEAGQWCKLGLEKYSADPRFAECELVLLGWSARGREQVTTAWQHLTAIEGADTLNILGVTWEFRRLMVAAVLARTGMRDSARAVLARTRAQRSTEAAFVEQPVVEAHVRVLLERTRNGVAVARGLSARRPEFPRLRRAESLVSRSPFLSAVSRAVRPTSVIAMWLTDGWLGNDIAPHCCRRFDAKRPLVVRNHELVDRRKTEESRVDVRAHWQVQHSA